MNRYDILLEKEPERPKEPLQNIPKFGAHPRPTQRRFEGAIGLTGIQGTTGYQGATGTGYPTGINVYEDNVVAVYTPNQTETANEYPVVNIYNPPINIPIQNQGPTTQLFIIQGPNGHRIILPLRNLDCEINGDQLIVNLPRSQAVALRQDINQAAERLNIPRNTRQG